MNMSNSEIAKLLMENDHLTGDEKQLLLEILGIVPAKESIVSKSEKISDNFTGFIGSWKFIIISITCIVIWMVVNFLLDGTPYAFDPYPYVFLNFVLACVAAIQAPIIMMSQNRQDKRESLKTQNDYEIDLKTIVIIEDLYRKTENVNNKLDEIIDCLDDDDKSKIIELNMDKGKKKDN